MASGERRFSSYNKSLPAFPFLKHMSSNAKASNTHTGARDGANIRSHTSTGQHKSEPIIKGRKEKTMPSIRNSIYKSLEEARSAYRPKTPAEDASVKRSTSSKRILAIGKRTPLLSRVFHPFFLKSPMSSSPSTSSHHSYSTKAARCNQSPWTTAEFAGGSCGDPCIPRNSEASPARQLHVYDNRCDGFGSSSPSTQSEESVKASLTAYALFRMSVMLKGPGQGQGQRNEDVSFFEDDFISFSCNNATAGQQPLSVGRAKMRQMMARVVSKF